MRRPEETKVIQRLDDGDDVIALLAGRGGREAGRKSSRIRRQAHAPAAPTIMHSPAAPDCNVRHRERVSPLFKDRMGRIGARWSVVRAEAVLRLRALRISAGWRMLHVGRPRNTAHKCRCWTVCADGALKSVSDDWSDATSMAAVQIWQQLTCSQRAVDVLFVSFDTPQCRAE